MNFFGVGGAELVLIIVIMMIVAGPKRMIRWMYVAGVYAGKLRDMWKEVAIVLQEEVDAAGIDFKVPEQIPTKQNLASSVNRFAQEAMKPLQEPLEDIQKDLKGIQNDVKTIQDEGKEAIAMNMNAIKDATTPKTPEKVVQPEPVAETAAQNGTASSDPAPDNTSRNDDFGTWSQM
ncbi:MAG: hypothetical protein ACPG7F_10995 [Aggregatilineales bacterium]